MTWDASTPEGGGGGGTPGLIGTGVTQTGANANAGGDSTVATGADSFAVGSGSQATGDYSHAEGLTTTASGNDSHAEGRETQASADHTHAEGYLSVASNTGAHAEGLQAQATGDYSHAEGDNTTASGQAAHSECFFTTASGNNSHAEGRRTTASEQAAHSEGDGTVASGYASHAEGIGTIASGGQAHAEGEGTHAFRYDETSTASQGSKTLQVSRAVITANNGTGDLNVGGTTNPIKIPVHDGYFDGKVTIFKDDMTDRWDLTFRGSNSATNFAGRAAGTVTITASAGGGSTTYGSSTITWAVTGDSAGNVLITPSATTAGWDRYVHVEMFELHANT
jgi:hypothetical protein